MTPFDRALHALGPHQPDLEAHLRCRGEQVAFSDGGRLSTMVSWMEDEIAAYRRDGAAPKVKDAPATVVEVREGAMRRKPRKG